MRKFVISMIAVFGVIILGLVILMASVISSGGFSTRSSFTISRAELVNTSNIRMEGIEELSLGYSSDDIYFYESDTKELILMEYMNISPDEKELTQLKQSGNMLRLRGGDRLRHNWIFNHYNGYVEVYLPADYRGSISASTSSGNIETDLTLYLTDLSVACSSGDIRINEVSAAKLSAATSSGDIRILSGNGETVVSSTSGNITVHNNTGDLKAEASSGDITIKAAVGYKEIETTSGNIRLSECSGYIKATASSGDTIISDLDGAGSFESTSGNINVSFTSSLEANRENIDAVSSSGDVTLKLPSKASFDFEANTSSGEIDTSFDDSISYKKDGDHASGPVGANPAFRIELETTSGNITVKN